MKMKLFFSAAFAFAVIIISYLVFSKPNYPMTFSNMDKVGHTVSFLGLTFLAYFAFKPKWYWMGLIMTAYAVLIELIQSQIPYRSASIADVVADLIGVVLFYLLLFVFRKYQAAKLFKKGPLKSAL
ncbi:MULTISPECIES: VanZ family protein [unclassified Shewanella]|uniref:VanZ family protein n=1 Tax=unclassified Shewanella TaxID=196818 RepID=UPI000C839A75|nr:MULTISPECIES: VanZ family protein [unclassified Shewanella]MDO6619154.1 VanZ family protein [Shewanella sp. 6_MG-2023]MDO6677278.1 VanZ family protein [Shewanella sp. 4_MG-2023]MDO6773938.1 VanZ family protein [Shewanella sp. 3_MG-2023]PMG31636.1 teicoplanin resistance protein VanZ [Shewanella sp. 10N.286.52.C2]PMG39812.1 teicoplanin resistance protein VanZ [Shewanella sp. 10N.286.52.B9]